MLRFLDRGDRLCDGWTRRETLRVGGLGLAGLTLPQLLRANDAATVERRPATAKSVIVLFMSGGLPQHETWDPKPDAPREIRGDFGTIATRTPGLMVGELMPRIAELTDRIAVIRSMVTGDNCALHERLPDAHRRSARSAQSGECASGSAKRLAGVQRRHSRSLPSRAGLPSSIALPRRLANNGGANPWPGTDAGRLGRAFDPWLLECDPSEEGFTMPGAEFPETMSQVRLDRRLSLLDQVSRELNILEDRASAGTFDRYREQAISLIAGGQGRTAFDLEQESAEVRDRYGRSTWGQSVLLARRLVEAGVSLVQVQWKSTDRDLPNSGGWDTHAKHSESLKGWLMPALDRTYSALLTDLDERGLLEETLVCLVTEFGHTPKFNKRLGRDHWGSAFSIALAGGGIRGGVVYGATDNQAAHPELAPVRPSDYLATIYHCLGFAPETMVKDQEGRPLPIASGHPIAGIL